MIIFRYLAKEVYVSLLAVTFVMVFVFLANQAIRWLSLAAAGDLATNTLLKLLGLQLPYLLGLLLPLGLYLGVLMSLSRMYAENEMTILFASGLSRLQLTKMMCIIASGIFVLVSILMFVINPLIASEKGKLLDSTSTGNFIASLVPGSFQETPGQDGVIYVKSLSTDKEVAQNLFIAKKVANKDIDKPDSWVIMSAGSGRQQERNSGDTFVVAENGYRYQGTPGDNDFQVTQFDTYGVKIDTSYVAPAKRDADAVSTLDLLANRGQDLDYVSELQWRMSLPLSVFVLTLLGVAVSKVRPRQGRFHQLAPAIILYIIYANLIFIARDWVSNNTVSSVIGVWWVHALFVLLALLIFVVQSDLPKRLLYQLSRAKK